MKNRKGMGFVNTIIVGAFVIICLMLIAIFLTSVIKSGEETIIEKSNFEKNVTDEKFGEPEKGLDKENLIEKSSDKSISPPSLQG